MWHAPKNAWNKPLDNIHRNPRPVELNALHETICLLNGPTAVGWFSLSDSCAAVVRNKKEKGRNAAHYYTAEQMGAHATRIQYVKPPNITERRGEEIPAVQLSASERVQMAWERGPFDWGTKRHLWTTSNCCAL